MTIATAPQRNVSPKRLILLPGLAADERMYAKVRHCLHPKCDAGNISFATPRLLVPHAYETMEGYAQRTAAELKLHSSDIIGGCSFGGMVACAIARAQPVAGLVLLSSALDSAAQARVAPLLNRIAQKLPFTWVRKFLASDRFLRAVFGDAKLSDIDLGRTMLLETPKETLRRGGALASTYHCSAQVNAPIYALHGTEDCVLKPPQIEQCTMIPGAGHGMVVSHPQQVADFLCDVVEKLHCVGRMAKE